MRSRLARIFPIRRQELPRVLPCVLIYFLVVGGVILGRNARDALFLNALGIKWLPYMYVANAFAVVACALIYSSFVDKISRSLLVLISFSVFIGALVLSRFVLVFEMTWFYVALYMIVQVIWLLSVMLFWTFAGDLFDTRSSKRLFPVINMGGLVGMVVAGFGGKPLVSLMGTENLIAVWGGTLFAAAPICLWTLKRFGGPKGAATSRTADANTGALSQMRDDFRDGCAYMRDSPLMKNLALITLAQWIVFTLVDYLFNAETRVHFESNTDAMSGFFGIFRGLAGAAALLVQLFATTQLISVFGVGKTMLVQPGFLVMSTGAMRLMYGFITGCIAKWGDHVLLYTIQESSYQLLYNPVPMDRRGRMRAFVEGYIKPVSMGIGGVALVIAAWACGENRQHLATLSFVLSLAWFFLARKVGGAYFEALVSNLADTADVREMTAHQLRGMRDEQTTGVLIRQLESDEEENVLFGLEIIQRMHPENTRKVIADKLRHPSPRVRAMALMALGEKKSKKSVGEIIHCLSDDDDTVRAAAAEALGRIGEPVEDDSLEQLLDDPSSAVRVEAAVALTSTGGLDGVLRVAEMLRNLVKSDDDENRVIAATVLGRLKTRHFTPSLLHLSQDANPAVQMAGLRALGASGDMRGLSVLIEAMEDRRYRYRARKAALNIVHRHPKGSVHELVSAFHRESLPSVRSRILDLLGSCSGAGILEVCLGSLRDPSSEVQARALDALWQRETRGGVSESTAVELRSYARDEIRELYEDLQVRAILESRYDAETIGVLADAIDIDNLQTRQRILRVIGLLTDRSTTRTIMNKLHSENPRMKADALEALDSLGVPEISRPLIATLDLADAGSVLALGRSVLGDDTPGETECLEQLLSHASVWLRAVTAHFIGLQRLQSSATHVEKLLDDPSGFVRETALVALFSVDPENARKHLERLTADPSPHVAATATRLSQGNVNHAGGFEMLATIDKILFLKSVSFFSGLHGEELRDLADIATESEHPADTVLYKPDDAADCLYVIVSGHCSVERETQGQKIELASLGSRDYFGEMSLLDGEPHTTTATLTEPSALLKLTRDSFREFIKEDPDVAFAVFRELTRRLRQYRDIDEYRHAEEAAAPVPSLSG